MDSTRDVDETIKDIFGISLGLRKTVIQIAMGCVKMQRRCRDKFLWILLVMVTLCLRVSLSRTPSRCNFYLYLYLVPPISHADIRSRIDVAVSSVMGTAL